MVVIIQTNADELLVIRALGITPHPSSCNAVILDSDVLASVSGERVSANSTCSCTSGWSCATLLAHHYFSSLLSKKWSQ